MFLCVTSHFITALLLLAILKPMVNHFPLFPISLETCLTKNKLCNFDYPFWLAFVFPPFPQIDIITAVVTVWRVRGKTIRSVLCNTVCNNCAQCDAHTYEQTNSSLDWVLSHWAHITVLRFIFVLCITVCCMHA